MGLMSFDAKDFDRPKVIEEPDPVNPEKTVKKNKGFFTPIGAGVLFKDADLFNKAYIEAVQGLSEKFKLPVKLPFYCSTHLKKEIGMKKAIPFCDELVAEVEDYIDLIHISYIHLCSVKIRNVGKVSHFMSIFNVLNEKSIHMVFKVVQQNR